MLRSSCCCNIVQVGQHKGVSTDHVLIFCLSSDSENITMINTKTQKKDS